MGLRWSNFYILQNDSYTKHGQAVRQADIWDLMRDMNNQAEKSMEDDPRPATHTPGSPTQPDGPMPMLEGEDQEWQWQ